MDQFQQELNAIRAEHQDLAVQVSDHGRLRDENAELKRQRRLGDESERRLANAAEEAQGQAALIKRQYYDLAYQVWETYARYVGDNHRAQIVVARKAMYTKNYRQFKELHVQLPESTHEMQDGMSAIRHWQGEHFWVKTDTLARLARIAAQSVSPLQA